MSEMVTRGRFLTPVVMMTGGSAIAVGSLVGSGWGAAAAVEVVTIAAAIGYYALGGRDSDIGAISGSRLDERQATIGTRAAALAGIAMALVALIGFVVQTARGASTWPFALFACVSAATFLTGLFVYQRRT
ncbi:MAG: hypothetical protein ACRDV4_00235 [Acidimicrobiales bacterium]